MNAWNLQNGTYKERSARGNAAVQKFKAEHNKLPNAATRFQAVAVNNKKAPPKAKWIERSTTVYGYEVICRPRPEDDDQYNIVVPDLLDEIPIFQARTLKEAKRAVGQKILELRLAERAKESQVDEVPQEQS